MSVCALQLFAGITKTTGAIPLTTYIGANRKPGKIVNLVRTLKGAHGVLNN